MTVTPHDLQSCQMRSWLEGSDADSTALLPTAGWRLHMFVLVAI